MGGRKELATTSPQIQYLLRVRAYRRQEELFVEKYCVEPMFKVDSIQFFFIDRQAVF